MEIRILLIEDTPEQVRAFRSAIARISSEIVVIDVPSFSAAFHALDGTEFDYIFVEPDLQQTMGFSEAVRSLVQHAPVQILKSHDPSFQRLARQLAQSSEQIGLVDTGNQRQIAELIEQLIKNKSGGHTTLRVEQARLEGKVARLEEGQKEVKATLTEHLKIVQNLSNTLSEVSVTLKFSVEQLKSEVAQLKSEVSRLTNELQDVSTVAESVANKSDDEQSEKTKLQVAIVMAVSTVMVGIGAPIAAHLFPKRHDDPPAISSPSPTPSPARKK